MQFCVLRGSCSSSLHPTPNQPISRPNRPPLRPLRPLHLHVTVVWHMSILNNAYYLNRQQQLTTMMPTMMTSMTEATLYSRQRDSVPSPSFSNSNYTTILFAGGVAVSVLFTSFQDLHASSCSHGWNSATISCHPLRENRNNTAS
jgi:hypothetical protein